MYICKQCQAVFEDSDEASVHAVDYHNAEFEDCFIIVEENSEKLTEGEEKIEVDEEPEEDLDESSVITTDREIEERKLAEKAVEAYMDGSLYEVEEKQLISKLAGMETGHRKEFPVIAKTSNAFERRYEEALDKLEDPESRACPICGQSWERLTSEIKKENLAQVDVTQKYESSFPIIRVLHIKAEHPSIAELLKGLFPVPEKTEVDVQHVEVSNPENCSREELAKAISSDPELTRAFYLRAFKKLQGKD